MITKETLFARYPALISCESSLDAALCQFKDTYLAGGKVLICGNGGSCADAEHISGELLKGFLSKRPIPKADSDALSSLFGEESKEIGDKLQRGIPAIPLTSLTSVLSAYANDVDPTLVYAQLVWALGRKEDLLIGISTSGNAENVFRALQVAKALGMKTLALTGEKDSRASSVADVTIKAPASLTYQIQEYHLPIYHYLCAQIEAFAFEGENT